MARKRKSRRQQHGSAWHWKQTDCWYFTDPSTKKRIALFDENGDQIRGKENKEQAQLSLARIKITQQHQLPELINNTPWTVARVCEVYLSDLHKTANPAWAKQVQSWLNKFCSYCGALKVSELKKKHLRNWLHSHSNWNPNTQRNVIGSVKAAFNFCSNFDDLKENPVAGYKKPTQTPKITSFSPEEEQAIYKAANESFGLFVKACILTGARPYSELAKITADHVVETDQGMYYIIKAIEEDGSHGHKTAKKTGKARRIMLCEEMELITKRLMLKSPQGTGVPLFLTIYGKPWKRCNGVQRFRDLRKRIGLSKEKTLYTARHTFAKRTLSGYYTGQPASIEVVAGLMGNTAKVCWEHYAQWADQYNDPLWKALGKEKKSTQRRVG